MSDDNIPPYSMPTKVNNEIHVAKLTTNIAGATASMFSGIPGLNTIASELFSKIVIPPLEKRRIEWLNNLAIRINKLASTISSYSPESLSKNQLFITVITQALQIAIRNHNEEKLEVLRNVVINSAKPLFSDDSLYLLFLNWIDLFTPWHIRILYYLDSFELPMKNGRIDTRFNSIPVVDKIKSNFPPNEVDRDLIVQILMDLSSRGILTVASQEFTIKGFKIALDANITKMGKDFLKFISE